MRTIAPENALAIEMLESAATTVHQAESILVDLETRIAAAKAEEEERNWERFEPFGAQAVTKPLASEIGFTKAWIDKDNGWFQVRNGASVAWTNGHVFDLKNRTTAASRRTRAVASRIRLWRNGRTSAVF